MSTSTGPTPTINQINRLRDLRDSQLSPTPQQGKDVFKELLKESGKIPQNNLQPNSPAMGVKFSQHAIERMHSRGISLTPEQLGRLDSAVNKAAEKGAKETLVLTDEVAMVVSVKNKTVITAMDRNMMMENVFTNIDSTVLI